MHQQQIIPPPFTISSNFEIVSFLSMTNGYSDRAAFVTVRNNGPATRLLKEYFVATFANSARAIAIGISSEDKVAMGEFQRFTVYFGKNTYPIVHVGTQ